jgi:hypothetical protein
LRHPHSTPIFTGKKNARIDPQQNLIRRFSSQSDL